MVRISLLMACMMMGSFATMLFAADWPAGIAAKIDVTDRDSVLMFVTYKSGVSLLSLPETDYPKADAFCHRMAMDDQGMIWAVAKQPTGQFVCIESPVAALVLFEREDVQQFVCAAFHQEVDKWDPPVLACRSGPSVAASGKGIPAP
jgi:hypothetical protein